VRALLLAIIAAAVACTAPSTAAATPTPVPTHEAGALNVTALLDLSGSRWPSGAPQRDALQLWTDRHASAAPRVRLRIVDVAGSASRTLIELRRSAVEDRADAIVVGVPVDYDDVFARAVQLAQLPVFFTLPMADPAIPGGGWAFALAPTPGQIAKATLDDAAARAVLASSIVVTDESASAIPERAALVADLAKRGVAATVVKATDATRLKTMLATAPVALFAGAPRPYADVARTATTGTLLYFSYLCDGGDIADLRDAAALATWPGVRWVAANPSGASADRVAFVQAFLDRAGPPTSAAASAFDALALLAAATDGSGDPNRLRDRLQTGSFVGVATTYSFTTSRHAGFASQDLAFLRYTGARATPVLR
jgi:ABC-type branched-subunit amino acid transport system substrate-binding protein